MWLLQVSIFKKAKTLWNSVKKDFDTVKLFIQCYTDSCCDHITGGVYLYGCVSLLAPVCAVFLHLCVWYQMGVLAKKQLHVLDLSKLTPCCLKQTTSGWFSQNLKNKEERKIRGLYEIGGFRTLFQLWIVWPCDFLGRSYSR